MMIYLKKKSFVLLKETGVESTLQTFLPQCLLEDIAVVSDSFKMEAAVRLFLCQFEVLGLAQISEESPHKDNIENIMDCSLQLKILNELTTYDGYYQKFISDMCHARSIVSEKNK